MPFMNDENYIALDDWCRKYHDLHAIYTSQSLAKNALKFITNELQMKWKISQEERKTETCCDCLSRFIIGDQRGVVFIDAKLMKKIFFELKCGPKEQEIELWDGDQLVEVYYFDIGYNNMKSLGIPSRDFRLATLTPFALTTEKRKNNGRELTPYENFQLSDD